MLSYTPFYFYKANVDNYDKIVGDAVLAFTIGETKHCLHLRSQVIIPIT